MKEFFKSYLSETGEISSLRVNIGLVLLTGLVLCCIPETSGTGLTLVGIAVGGKAVDSVGGRLGQRSK